MRYANLNLSLTALGAAALTLLAGPVQAATSRMSEAAASLLADNVWIRPNDGTTWVNYAYDPATPVTINGNREYVLTDALGQTQLTTFSYTATSSSEFGALHVSASVAVSNPQERGDRPVYAIYDGNGYAVQPGGVPDGYNVRAYASVFDTVQVGRGDVTQVQFQLALDGSLNGLTEAQRTIFMPSASVQLDQRDNGVWSNVFFQGSQPSYDSASDTWAMGSTALNTTFWSNSFTVTAGQAMVQFELWANAEVSALSGYGLTGGSFAALADFSNTVRVVGVRGFNAMGEEVALGQVIGESGTVYALAPVPEPASWAMMLAGAAGMFGLTRRRSNARRV